MKIYSTRYSPVLVIGAAMIMAIFITRPVFSQEAAKKEGKKIVKINVVTEDNGKTTVMDTTMEVPDSAMMDSIQDEIDKVMEIGNGPKHARLRFKNMPREFNYDFEMPSLPHDCELELEQLGDLAGHEWEEGDDFTDSRALRLGKGHREMLNDILGDIPMDRVKNYSVKETKNGKRITIELDNSPIFEKENRIIVIREPGRARGGNHLQHRMKVIRHMDGDSRPGNSQEPQAPPPPPPPPDVKPGKAPSTTPKI